MKLFYRMRQQKLLSVTMTVFTLSVGILIGTLLNTQVHAARSQAVAPDATPLTVPKAMEAPNEFTKIAKALEPSVVYIEVTLKQESARNSRRGAQQQQDDGDDDGSDLFRRFFGQGSPFGGDGQGQVVPPQALRREASGSGFIVDRNGYIVTNRHVVENADRITVKLQGDPTEYRAKVIGTDYETDLAVIKIDAHRPLQPVTIGNSDSVQVGDWAIAIGSPFTLEESVTLGIVSALGRGQDQILEARSFQRFIQTDAAINPGNSGGPLVNIRGEVIGVNTMIATSRGGSEGVGFALPSNMVVRVYNDIIRDGRVSRSAIGITFNRSSNPVTLKGLGLDHGIIVQGVNKGGPSEKAGLKADDIILAINGKPVKDSDDLMSRVSDTPVGDTIDLTVDRDGKKMDFKVVTADRVELNKDRPEIVGEYIPAAGSAEPATSNVKFGILLREASADERGLTPNKRGVVITQVEQGSFAEDIGLEDRDIITEINRKPVNSRDDVAAIAQSLKPGDAVTFHVIRPAQAQARTVRGRASNVPTDPQSLFLAGTLPGN
ncbi:MAG TPA: Do family serine endopeptidase [Bryobacteraceae bacterium]|nr:Do family serine endopeptidase [Bryobacteraceae bacterium]